MASTYSTNLKIELIGTGEQSGIWGATTNTNLGTALEQAIVGKADVTMSSTTVTLSLTNTNAAQNARAFYLNLTGTPGGAATLEVPAVQKPYVVRNGTTGGNPVTVKVSGQTGVTVPNGATMWLYNNGTDVVNAITNLPSGATVGGVAISTGSASGTVESVALDGGTTGITVSGSPITTTGTFTLSGTVAATHGGTAQSTYSTGDILFASATNTLSRRTVGSTGQVLTVSGGVPVWSTLSAGSGTVTSVGGTGTVNGITLTGTVTTSGNLTLGGTLSNVSLSSQVTGTLPVANGGTGITSFGTGVATFLGTPSSANLAAAVTDETGSGALVFATSPTLVTPALGTPASGNLQSCTADGTNAVGFRTIPQNSRSAAYTLVLADSGKHILHPSADTTARTFTIPANSSVAFPIGTAITFINQNGAGVVTIAITSDTMRLSPGGTTGSRTLAANGSATAIKITSTEWIISGSGLT
jgi:hypothetical protein